MKKTNTKSGFTLIELLVVIAIIGILSAVVTSSLQSGRAKARNAERLQTVDSLAKAMEVYATTSGTNKYPKSATNPAGWYCLGKADNSSLSNANNASGVNTGNSGAWCNTTNYGFDSTLNNNVKAALSGGVIPRNSSYPTTYSKSYYRYHPSFTPSPASGAYWQAKGSGAYLVWSMEGENANCGRGDRIYNGSSSDKNSTCALRLADSQ